MGKRADFDIKKAIAYLKHLLTRSMSWLSILNYLILISIKFPAMNILLKAGIFLFTIISLALIGALDVKFIFGKELDYIWQKHSLSRELADIKAMLKEKKK